MYHVADLLIRIKNNYMADKDSLVIDYSKIKKEILEVLKKNGYVSDYKVFKDDKFKKIEVSLDFDKAGFTNVRIISKPGKRVYRNLNELKNNKSRLGILVVSTSKGVMSGREAIKSKSGGEVLCKIW